MRPYDKSKVVLRNWRKADSLKDCTITPNVWTGCIAYCNDLIKVATNIKKSGLPKRVRKMLAKKLL